MIYAIVKDGKTINIIEWDGKTELKLPEGEILIPQEKAPKYLPQIENHSVPSTITPAQLRIWLVRNGLGMTIIDTLLNSIKDEKKQEEAKIRWEFGLSITKEDQIFKLLGDFMILTNEQKDQIMIEASRIV
jgi:hypothetical protein